MKLILRDGHRPIAFLFPAASEAIEEFSVEKRYPPGLSAGSPMLEDEKNACRVINARVAIVREEEAFDLGVIG